MGIVHQRRKAETRALLVAAGLQLFSEQGFELVTLDEVALAAGFTKGAIYRHFPSKGAFLLALRSEEHTSELQSLRHLVCRLLLEKKKPNCAFAIPCVRVRPERNAGPSQNAPIFI